jgi:WD40 repeat protein
MALSWDGGLLAAGSTVNGIRVWDVANGNVLWRLPSSRVDHVAFSPDCRTIAICASDKVMFSGRIEVWDYRAGQRIHILHGHSPAASCSTFTADGRRLATGGSDTTVMVWDLETGKEQFTFRGHTGLVLGVAFSPDNTRLASCSYDGTVRIWDVRPLE